MTWKLLGEPERPTPQPKPRSADELEAERAVKHAAAKAAMFAAENAMSRCAELRPEITRIESEKRSACDECDVAAAPLRDELARIEKLIDAERPTGKPLSVQLLEQRDHVSAQIQRLENKKYFLAIEFDELSKPLTREIADLRHTIERTTYVRRDLFRFAPPEIAAQLFTADSSMRWAESRLNKARELNGSTPSTSKSAEMSAAAAALESAKTEMNAASAAALNTCYLGDTEMPMIEKTVQGNVIARGTPLYRIQLEYQEGGAVLVGDLTDVCQQLPDDPVASQLIESCRGKRIGEKIIVKPEDVAHITTRLLG